MKLLVIASTGQAEIVEAASIPPAGARVDRFYEPWPAVKSILMWPTQETLEKSGIKKEAYTDIWRGLTLKGQMSLLLKSSILPP